MTEKINSVLDLVFRINEETKYAAFFEIMGHIGKLHVSVRRDKVNLYNITEYLGEVDNIDSSKQINEEINDIIHNLEKFLEVQ